MREALGLLVVVIVICLLFKPEETAKQVGNTWHAFATAAFPPTCANPH